MLIGYMHVTKGEQSLDLQRDALARVGCERVNMLGRYAFTLLRQSHGVSSGLGATRGHPGLASHEQGLVSVSCSAATHTGPMKW
jgi:hypothetical protein